MCEYSDNEGKEVMVKIGRTLYTGIVIGCDPDVGITVVNIDDKDHYLVCSHGMSSPILKRRLKRFDMCIEGVQNNVDETNEIIMRGIDIGVIDCSLFGSVGYNASAESCSFA